MASTTDRNIKAQRGGELRCKGWRQEAILRMLENNLENAERPEDDVDADGDGTVVAGVAIDGADEGIDGGTGGDDRADGEDTTGADT